MTYRGRHRRPSWTGMIVWVTAYTGLWATFSAYATAVVA